MKSSFSPLERAQVAKDLGKEVLLASLEKMVLIRHFETRAESAYQHGHIGGFFHSYAGQEAIQSSLVAACGQDNWYIGFYRCHALALLLGATPNEIMAELYGRKTGNALGRGGSMHLFTSRLLGGFAIVGGHLPIAIGAAFSLKYQKKEGEIAICFLGEGAVAQGAYHESLNLAALWHLPILFVIENNQWGMGTHVSKAIAVDKIAQKQAASYGIKGYTLDGMDFFACYKGFKQMQEEIIATQKPILVECLCERFRGHSISDPALYRTKEHLSEKMRLDPIVSMRTLLQDEGLLTEDEFKQIDQKSKERVIEAMKYAEEASWPSPTELEEGVYAP